MRWSYNLERSRLTATWLFIVAFLILAMVVVGGATRLTGSGLSITEWKPITGALPPLSDAAWAEAFAKYQQIPQYKLVNRGIGLSEFKSLFWWEWGHRLLGRLIGVVFAAPFLLFLALRRIPRRLIWRCWVLLGLGGLQGLVGWWMVASGLSERISVAPERLAAHLGLALIVFLGCLWVGLEAWFGKGRTGAPAPGWTRLGAYGLLGLTFLQTMLGALVAGNDAGRVNTDWPLMQGRLFPADYHNPGEGLWRTLAHNVAAVQFNHRVGAYLLFVLAVFLAARMSADRLMSRTLRRLGLAAAAVVTFQVLLGIETLRHAAPLTLSLFHQAGAVSVLAVALALSWRAQRAG
jgi:cytochrome c oxidase assembly protein subunit 15